MSNPKHTPKGDHVAAAVNQVAAGEQADAELEVHPEWDLKSVVFPKANLRGPELTITAPATAVATLKGRTLLEQICEANRLGTHRPSAFVVSIDPDRTRLWLVPVTHSDSPSALPITYDRIGFRFNLYKAFRLLGRLIQGGTKEIYTLEATPNRIKVGEVVGQALVVQLNQYTRRQVRRMTEAQKAERQARRLAKQNPDASTPT